MSKFAILSLSAGLFSLSCLEATTTSLRYGYDSGGRWGLIETKQWGNSSQQTTTFTPSYQSSYQPTRAWDAPNQPDPSDNRRQLAYWESSAERSRLVRAVQNDGDWREAAELTRSDTEQDPDKERGRERNNTALLFAVREALKKEDFNLAWDIACYCGRNSVEAGGKGFNLTALAAERGYSDIYFFLVEKMEDPRAVGMMGTTLMDWLDQGIEEYGINENYQAIKQDLIRRGVKLRMRNSGGGCCLIM